MIFLKRPEQGVKHDAHHSPSALMALPPCAGAEGLVSVAAEQSVCQLVGSYQDIANPSHSASISVMALSSAACTPSSVSAALTAAFHLIRVASISGPFT